MREMMESIEERKRQGNWIEYDVQEMGRKDFQPIPVKWWQTDKGITSSVKIGLPQISNSVPPKPRKKWIPVSSIRFMTPNIFANRGNSISAGMGIEE